MQAAIAVARRLGVDEAVLGAAESMLSGDRLRVDVLLQELEETLAQGPLQTVSSARADADWTTINAQSGFPERGHAPVPSRVPGA